MSPVRNKYILVKSEITVTLSYGQGQGSTSSSPLTLVKSELTIIIDYHTSPKLTIVTHYQKGQVTQVKGQIRTNPHACSHVGGKMKYALKFRGPL